MGFILVFSIKSAIILTVLYAIYLLTAKRYKGASIRRVILLGIYLCAALLPLLDLSGFQNPSSIVLEKPTAIANTFSAAPTSFPNLSLYTTLGKIVSAGIVVLIIQLMATFLQVAYLKRKGQTSLVDGIKLTVLDSNRFTPFCFGNSIFLPKAEVDKIPDMVMSHEKSHILHHHFLDLIFGRLLTIFQWWNPFAWLMLRELQDIHEFQADEDVLAQGYSSLSYQYMLLNYASGKRYPVPSHGIRHTHLRQRLKMINKEEAGSKKFYSSMLMIPGAVAALLVISSPMLSPFFLSASNIRLKQTTIVVPSAQTNVHQASHSNDPHVIINGVPSTMEVMQQLSPDEIERIDVRKSTPLYPNGVVEVTLRNTFSAASFTPDHNGATSRSSDNILDEVVVVGPAMTVQNSK